MLDKIKINLPFLLIGFIHFAISTFITWNSEKSSTQEILVYILLKTLSFLLIIIFWQLIPFFYNEIKNNNKLIKDFLKFFIIYFLINFIVLLLIWPGYTHHEFILQYLNIKKNILTFQLHWLSSLITGICYHIFPFVSGLALINIFTQSIIFGYCILNTKRNLSNNYYLLLIIPFCLPIFLIYNTTQIRTTLSLSLSIYILFFVYFHQNKKIDLSNILSSLLGIITAIIIILRMELFPFIFLLPISIFLLKIYSRKTFIIYTLSLIIFFGIATFIQKKFIGLEYELHCLSYSYERLQQTNIKNTNTEKDLLKKVFPEIEEKGIFSKMNLENEKDTKNVLQFLIQTKIKNSFFFIQKNWEELTNKNLIITSPTFYIPDKIQHPLNKDVANSEIRTLNEELRIKTIQILTHDNKIFPITILYSPTIICIYLILLLIYGLKKKKYFYLYYFFNWNIILIFTLLIMPFFDFLYVYHFFIIGNITLVLALIEILENRKNN